MFDSPIQNDCESKSVTTFINFTWFLYFLVFSLIFQCHILPYLLPYFKKFKFPVIFKKTNDLFRTFTVKKRFVCKIPYFFCKILPCRCHVFRTHPTHHLHKISSYSYLSLILEGILLASTIVADVRDSWQLFEI